VVVNRVFRELLLLEEARELPFAPGAIPFWQEAHSNKADTAVSKDVDRDLSFIKRFLKKM
jgi:hypothetical protein